MSRTLISVADMESDELMKHAQVSPESERGDNSEGQVVISSDFPQIQLYKKRWLMLGLFCLYSFSNSFQWIHLNIISNIVIRYYNESLPGDSLQQEAAVDWLFMVYMLAYIPLVFPATWLMDSKGLRVCNVVGSLLNAVGAWIKCASVSPDRFGVLMFAQTICSVAQIWVLGLPAPLAAAWFGSDEVSTATSIGVFGNQVLNFPVLKCLTQIATFYILLVIGS